MSEQLKPCPFCGGQAVELELTDEENIGGSVITCTCCAASSAVHFDRKENLRSGWNDRKDDRVFTSEVEELAAAHSNYLNEGLHCFSIQRLKEFAESFTKIAVFRERERCAMIADDFDQQPGGDDEPPLGPVAAGQVQVAQSIAGLIREDGEFSSALLDNEIAAAIHSERKRLALLARGRGALPFGECECLGGTDPETGIRECSLEVKGHDCLCTVGYEMADEIAKAIEGGAQI